MQIVYLFRKSSLGSSGKPNTKLSNITLVKRRTVSANASVSDAKDRFSSTYTGAITGEGAKGWRGFFRINLGAPLARASGNGRDVGNQSMIANFLFLFLAISGALHLVSALPELKHSRAAMVFRRKVKGKA